MSSEKVSVVTVDDTDTSRMTLSQVAEEANVSISTVSKVLNGRSGVAESTRARVEQLLNQHDYNRRNSAQIPSLIEVVFDQIDMAWAVEILRGVNRVAREHGLSMVVTECGDRESSRENWLDGVIARQPAGVVLVTRDLSADETRQLSTRKIPFVLVDAVGDPSPGTPAIGSANWNGGLIATEHLLELGHTRIAMITGPEAMTCSRARLSGYRSALDAAGVRAREEYVVAGEFHREDGTAAALKLLDLNEPPTAIFAGSDLQAFGVYEAARSRGVRIPEDLSVIGYDDLQIAKWAGPPLTTVRQPLTDMAEAAARLVLRLRSGETVENYRVDLATNLVVRSSAASPRK
ncbi:LacI family DNA-binding transcriptional regulator [Mycetocola saprophilus]|uniref:LacI family DNA-binding transcriptional regulator n=1 Tax=Mycetocola saprophilus TaxID=76636 RepID=UPI0004C18428|nr:LacI family DNA-binding transcriptional regulator [Mycetocola saprophilus]